jgi:pimeloyl-ACP methyl ester carboxylesterase
MKIIIQNLVVNYKDEGSGPVALFLHGWQDNLHTFDSLIPFLTSNKKRTIRLDLPGFGESDLPKENWDLDDYIRFIDDFVKKLNIQVDVLIGHSFGGRIIVKGVADKILKANKIILIGSAGVAKNHSVRNLILKVLAKIFGLIMYVPPLNSLREKIRKKIYDLIGSDYFGAGPLKETFLKIIKKDLSERAKNITTPTLLIWGKNDKETPIVDAEKFHRLIPKSKLKIIDGAGHFVHKENPREVAELINLFV